MIKWMHYYKGVWADVLNSARTTVGKPHKDGFQQPSTAWKRRAMLAEHSMIRKVRVQWMWSGIKYWVSVHFTRHFLGILHFVKTQRSDRTGVNRDRKWQSAKVDHECDANVQALINMSRRRLCNNAAPDTRKAWIDVKAEIGKLDPDIASCMVPECIYRGFCPDFKCCGYCYTAEYKERLEAYRNHNVLPNWSEEK